jgi:hypothetical protein
MPLGNGIERLYPKEMLCVGRVWKKFRFATAIVNLISDFIVDPINPIN